MNTSDSRLRRGHRLLQLGILLFLFALLVGLAVPRFAVPRLALSVHLLGIMQGLFLVVLGLLWPRLAFTPRVSTIAFWLAVYGCFVAWTANLLGAIWGAGNTIVPIAAGQARGSDLQEGVINVLLRTAAAALIATAVVVLWGLRGKPNAIHD
jgi:hydroxylaminobenzene mutase